jgi:hypothetical protein
MSARGITDGNVGHDLATAAIEVEVRMFNSLTRYAEGLGHSRRLRLKPGATVGDVLSMLGIPSREVFFALVNGRDFSPGTGDTEHRSSEGPGAGSRALKRPKTAARPPR